MQLESSGGTTDIVAMEFIPSRLKQWNLFNRK